MTSSVLETVLHVSNRTIRKMEKKGVLQRPGEIIFKGHQSYDLMLNLQQGIRYSIGRITPMKMPKVLSADSAFQKVRDTLLIPRRFSGPAFTVSADSPMAPQSTRSCAYMSISLCKEGLCCAGLWQTSQPPPVIP